MLCLEAHTGVILGCFCSAYMMLRHEMLQYLGFEFLAVYLLQQDSSALSSFKFHLFTFIFSPLVFFFLSPLFVWNAFLSTCWFLRWKAMFVLSSGLFKVQHIEAKLLNTLELPNRFRPTFLHLCGVYLLLCGCRPLLSSQLTMYFFLLSLSGKSNSFCLLVRCAAFTMLVYKSKLSLLLANILDWLYKSSEDGTFVIRGYIVKSC